MVQLTPEHFEIIDRNKARKYKREQEEMRNDLQFFILNCDMKQLAEIYGLYKKLKRNRT